MYKVNQSNILCLRACNILVCLQVWSCKSSIFFSYFERIESCDNLCKIFKNPLNHIINTCMMESYKIKEMCHYLLPPKTQFNIKGITLSIKNIPPTLPGCGILNLVKNCNVKEPWICHLDFIIIHHLIIRT